jgi:PadR family transcriptional regulator PadR
MLYPILHRLEREGLIESNWSRSDTGRKRKYYRLKRDGKKALAADRLQ